MVIDGALEDALSLLIAFFFILLHITKQLLLELLFLILLVVFLFVLPLLLERPELNEEQFYLNEIGEELARRK